MIRKARETDLKGIYNILEDVGHSRKDPVQGFLMRDYTREREQYLLKYRGELKRLPYFYVLENEGRVQAFLMAYPKKEWLKETPCWEEEIFWHPSFQRSCLDNYVLINQTAMYPALTGRGLGSRLYQALFKDLKKEGITHVFAETVIAPTPNFASLNFRIKQIYQLAGVRYEKNEEVIYTTLVYHKEI